MEIYPWQPCLFLPDQARLNKTRFAEDTTQTIHAKAQLLILNPKRQPWQGNILVRDNIIINMVDTGILISFHNY
jgi:hypothetical protein